MSTLETGHTKPLLDTVSAASGTPEVEQPWSELGLKPDEYQRIRDILGRRPTEEEPIPAETILVAE